MIYNYIGSGTSYIGLDIGGITFSTNGLQISGISGSSPIFTIASYSGDSTFTGDRTPIIFMNAPSSPLLDPQIYTLPSSPPDGTTISLRRVESVGSGGSAVNSSGTDLIRLRGSSTTQTTVSISATVSTCKRFFYYKGPASVGIWWEI